VYAVRSDMPYKKRPRKCGLYELVPTKHPSFVDGRVARVILNGHDIGTAGTLSPEVLKRFHIVNPVSALELELQPLLDLVKSDSSPFSTQPHLVRPANETGARGNEERKSGGRGGSSAPSSAGSAAAPAAGDAGQRPKRKKKKGSKKNKGSAAASGGAGGSGAGGGSSGMGQANNSGQKTYRAKPSPS